MLKIADNQLQWIRYCLLKWCFQRRITFWSKVYENWRVAESYSPLLPRQTQKDRFTSVRVPERRTSMKTDSFERDRHSASQLWCRSASRSSAALISILLSEPGIKVNGAYYRDNLLAQKLLPDMRWLAQNEFFCIPTGRRPGASSTRHRRFPGSRDAGLHSSNTVTTKFAGL